MRVLESISSILFYFMTYFSVFSKIAELFMNTKTYNSLTKTELILKLDDIPNRVGHQSQQSSLISTKKTMYGDCDLNHYIPFR